MPWQYCQSIIRTGGNPATSRRRRSLRWDDKVGNDGEVVGSDVGPDPTSPDRYAGSRQDMVDPGAEVMAEKRRPFRIAEAESGRGKCVGPSGPDVAIDGAFDGHVEIAGSNPRP